MSNGLLFIGPILREVARKYAGPIARGLANVERPAFNYAYRGNRMGRLKKPIYAGYKAGTVIGTVGAQLRDAYISSLQESPPDSLGKTGKHMVQFGRKRKYTKERCPPNYGR